MYVHDHDPKNCHYMYSPQATLPGDAAGNDHRLCCVLLLSPQHSIAESGFQR